MGGLKRKIADVSTCGVSVVQEGMNAQILQLVGVMSEMVANPDVVVAVLENLYRVCATPAGRAAIVRPEVFKVLAEVARLHGHTEVGPGLATLWQAALADRPDVQAVIQHDACSPWAWVAIAEMAH
jgi:hypothetical protein